MHAMFGSYGMPQPGRMMVFVDGENLVLRYQAMVEKGWVPRDDVSHLRDIYAWTKGSVQPGLNQVIRATYYTYASGDSAALMKHREAIKNLEFMQFRQPEEMGPRKWTTAPKLHQNLHACVFHKPNRSRSGKGVDIQMTIDILTQVHMDNLDSVYLVSGDGDYKPVLDEAIRHGKRVYVAALSDGLNRDLRTTADEFIDLDYRYFTAMPEGSG